MQEVEVRFMRIKDAANHFGVDEETVEAYAKASGAFFQLQRIKLIKVEDVSKLMKHFTTVGRNARLIQRKYVRIAEGSVIYNIGQHRFIEMARAAGAVYKIGDSQGSAVLVRLDVFDEYMEQFRESPVEMKHPLWKEADDGVLT